MVLSSPPNPFLRRITKDLFVLYRTKNNHKAAFSTLVLVNNDAVTAYYMDVLL